MYDVAIIGGGISGLMAAALLGQEGLSIIVLDKASLDKSDSIAHPLRYFAINEASKRLFDTTNTWPKDDISPYLGMEICDQNSKGLLTFSSTEFSLPYLGHIVSEKALKLSLLNRLSEMPTVTLLDNSELIALELNDNASLYTKHQSIRAKMLIAADGANSWVKKTLNLITEAKSYEQNAIVANVKTEQPHQKKAYQIFTSSGPLAFLPLQSPQECSIVYSCTSPKFEKLMAYDDEQFTRALAASFEHRLGNVISVSKRISFPLIQRHCKQYVAPKVALVADAIHTIHPLAGLGLNLGLKDVAVLTSELLLHREHLGDFQLLRRYERARKGHNALTISMMSGIKDLFSIQGLPGYLRGLGMNLVSNMPYLKKQMIKQAMML